MLAALAFHAQAVNGLVTGHDQASRGWLSLGGWTFVLSTARVNLIAPFGAWVAAAIVPLALLGAGAWRSGSGIRLICLLAGYTLGFMMIGRPENDYWGFVTAPLLAVGLCLAPMALGDLIRQSIGRVRPIARQGGNTNPGGVKRLNGARGAPGASAWTVSAAAAAEAAAATAEAATASEAAAHGGRAGAGETAAPEAPAPEAATGGSRRRTGRRSWSGPRRG